MDGPADARRTDAPPASPKARLNAALTSFEACDEPFPELAR